MADVTGPLRGVSAGANGALYKQQPVFCITSDVDWASEDAIRIQQAILDRYEVHATYFLTHQSAVLSDLLEKERIDVGIHPNFLPGSSHGRSFDEIIDCVIGLAPNARCFRSHRYFDVTDVTHRLVERGLLYDSNVCTNLQSGIGPMKHESGLIRFPTFYEDGTQMCTRQGWDFASFSEVFRSPGLKVIGIHPMVTAMNVTTPEYWADLKRRFPPDRWIRMTAADVARERCPGIGPATFLERLLAMIKDDDLTLITLEEVYAQFGQVEQTAQVVA